MFSFKNESKHQIISELSNMAHFEVIIIFDQKGSISHSFVEKMSFPGDYWLISEIVSFSNEMKFFCQFPAKMLQNT